MANPIKKPDMIISPHRVQKPKPNQGAVDASNRTNGFDKYLQQEVQKQQKLRFSAHAAKRLQSRHIALTQQQENQLSKAVDQAADKGVQDSLILLNRLAFVVNVKNRTVVTAMDESQLKGGIFTNIDGAMIISEE
jgi:flagellar operon protein